MMARLLRLFTLVTLLEGTATASSDGYGALVDLDVGTVAGIRLGYDAGRLAVGGRLAQGPAFRTTGRILPAGLLAVFGSIGVDNGDEPYMSLEPSLGVGVVYDGGLIPGLALGSDVAFRFTRDEGMRSRPWVGARLGADLLIAGGLTVLPTAAVTLSW